MGAGPMFCACADDDSKCWSDAIEDAADDSETKTKIGMTGTTIQTNDPSGLMMQLQGQWYRRASGEVVGQIIDNELLWDSKRQNTSPLYQVTPSQIEMITTDRKTGEQQSYVADVSLEAQATLSWPDGDIWIRK
eukprot:TRINITY_DN6189_c0_g1_i3.p1 TRINITY_DN6189_c0_g1~~TRINITY_DN6189_c0_g1_i3.p1  ORF type:complete len:151 (-),score=17.98 TRINITY_DN6189_c0_g1_i3:160-561(-)